MSDRQTEHDHRVTALELFFDLVVVFAITQVTTFLSLTPTWGGLLRGLLLLGALWWAWAGYAWLTNNVDPEQGGVRVAMFGATGAMLVVALATPKAFAAEGVTFGVAYLAVRVILLVLFGVAARGDHRMQRTVARIVPPGVIGPGLLVVAGFLDGPGQLALWAAALAIDYFGVLIGDVAAWRISPEHFAERNGLIVIIALGESIFAIGVGAAGEPLVGSVIVAALLGIVVAAALWWSYFDWVAFAIEARLAELTGSARAALARDGYSYLHLPMVAGIVLFALGLKTTIAHVDESLPTIPAVGLCGGLALYLLAHVALRLRMGAGLGRGRPVASLLLVALIPVAIRVTALASLGFVAAACASLIAYEAVRHSDTRAFIRSRRGAFRLEEAIRVETNSGGERDARQGGHEAR
jgi:low temperature requirement protein LtrA